jgi:DNA mismatch endonuclease (patch repair protein)
VADRFSSETRSRIMSAIRGRHTKPEMAVRRFLHARGLRYRLHAGKFPGRPDIMLRRFQTVVFVHGCFWHSHPGCQDAIMPKTNRAFWRAKLAANVRRDAAAETALRKAGWRVCVVWECEINQTRLERLVAEVRRGA